MKRILLTILIVALCVPHIFAQDEATKEIYKLYREKKYSEALKSADKAIKEHGESEQLLVAKFYTLKALDKNDEAKKVAAIRLDLVNGKIKEEGEDYRSLSLKYGLLKELGRMDGALKAAIRSDELAEKKRPWGCLDIAGMYLEKKDTGKALDWLSTAVDRGYISYSALMEDDYKLLHDNKGFKKLVKKIKKNIGIGKEAKDFTLELISGESFTLSEQEGKVILVDFWATWCGPCLAEIPNVKDVYAKFKDKGFEIIGISLDREKEPLDNYIQEEELGWKFAYSGQYWSDPTAKAWGVNSIPSMWLVDRKGKLRHFGVREEALVEAVEKLIAE